MTAKTLPERLRDGAGNVRDVDGLLLAEAADAIDALTELLGDAARDAEMNGGKLLRSTVNRINEAVAKVAP